MVRVEDAKRRLEERDRQQKVQHAAKVLETGYIDDPQEGHFRAAVYVQSRNIVSPPNEGVTQSPIDIEALMEVGSNFTRQRRQKSAQTIYSLSLIKSE